MLPPKNNVYVPRRAMGTEVIRQYWGEFHKNGAI